jgi:hypothetical protein
MMELQAAKVRLVMAFMVARVRSSRGLASQPSPSPISTRSQGDARAAFHAVICRFGFTVDALWNLPAAHLCDLLVHKGEALADPLHALIVQCLSGSSTTVVEGEGIHPGLAPHHPVEQVRFAFVVEPEQAALFQTLTRRSARFRALPEAHQDTVAATNWRYGNWLRQQAQQFGQPWLEPRPWATLPDRLIQAWHQPRAPIR